MQHVLDAIQSDASSDDFANLAIPESYRAVHVLKDEQEMWKGVPTKEKDPRKSLHVGEVPTPEIAPDEVYLAVMASSINFNTVWSSIFEPVSTFGPMARLARESSWAKRHDQPYQVVGSDASGVVLKVGAAVRNWKPGDRITVHCNHVDDQDQSAHDDSMMAANQRIWGYETNFGGLADLAVVKANQLMPKPAHLTWEEAAVSALCNSTSYRMLVSRNGAQMKQGDVVLIAPQVQTGAQALVQAPNGATILAAGQKVELTGRGLEGIRMQLQAPGDQAVNLGTLRGDAVGIFASQLKHSGLIQATGVSTEGGRVLLTAARDSLVDGQVSAVSGTRGGGIDVLGQRVGLLAGAVLDASGAQGGGVVRVGGDFQGKNHPQCVRNDHADRLRVLSVDPCGAKPGCDCPYRHHHHHPRGYFPGRC